MLGAGSEKSLRARQGPGHGHGRESGVLCLVRFVEAHSACLLPLWILRVFQWLCAYRPGTDTRSVAVCGALYV